MVEKEDLVLIEKLYGFQIYKLNKLNSSSQNNVFLIFTSIGYVIVKIYSKYVKQSWIHYQEKHIKFLIRQKVISKNLFIKNQYGYYFSNINNKYINVTNYIKSKFFQLNNQDNIRAVARYLARLHKIECPNHFVQYKLPKLSDYSVNENELSRVCGINKRDIDRLIKNYHKLEFAIKRVAKHIDLLPKCVIHGDMHSRNILLNNSQIIVIDWDDSYIGPRVLDLLKAMYSLCKNENGSFSFSSKNVGEFLREYKSYIKLKEIEHQFISDFLTIIFTTNLTHYKLFTDCSQRAWYLDWTFKACEQIEEFEVIFKELS
ncbi:phosphotransferase [Streptococcus oralis]|uniref:phosphotransferase n=1 Tax=Streptococcus oralis TaxID=1303 RepID=UPI00228506FA|nr:phosphotransferase [Streptococcus oralis]MCY7079220.1 phosphotransferase [Streptococcus oralis]